MTPSSILSTALIECARNHCLLFAHLPPLRVADAAGTSYSLDIQPVLKLVAQVLGAQLVT